MGCKLPFNDASFDLVLSNGVLEHVGGFTEELSFLSECYRVLKKDGYMVISVLPIKGSAEWVTSKLGLKSLTWHDRFYDEVLIRNLLDSTGFKIVNLERKEIVPDVLGTGPLHGLGVTLYTIEKKLSETPLRMFGKSWTAIARKNRYMEKSL